MLAICFKRTDGILVCEPTKPLSLSLATSSFNLSYLRIINNLTSKLHFHYKDIIFWQKFNFFKNLGWPSKNICPYSVLLFVVVVVVLAFAYSHFCHKYDYFQFFKLLIQLNNIYDFYVYIFPLTTEKMSEH